MPFAYSNSEYAGLADVAQSAPSPSPLPPVLSDNTYIGTSGNNTKTGTAGDDVFKMYQGGHDTVYGGSGDDAFHFGNTFESGDTIFGGDGSDTLYLSGGAYASGLTITSAMVNSVDGIVLASGSSYKFTITDAVVASGQTFVLAAGNVDAAHSVSFDGSADTNGGFLLYGGAGDDTLIVGAHGGDLQGNGGADTLVGGAGENTFAYIHPSESTGEAFDTITDFSCNHDFIYAAGLDGFDGKITHGSLSTGTIDHDLEAAIHAHQLKADHAVLFVPSSGTLAGKTFLILDENGTPGYQAGADYVIGLDHTQHLSAMSAANFEG